MEKDLRGADVASELSLHLKEVLGGAEGQWIFNLHHSARMVTSCKYDIDIMSPSEFIWRVLFAFLR